MTPLPEASSPHNPAALPFIVTDHERRLTHVEHEVEPMPVLAEKVAQLGRTMRVVATALWTIAGGIVLLVLTRLIEGGGP